MRDRLLLAALKTVPTSLAEHVTREFLDILPRLQQGVRVRVHDIFVPHDYPAEWLMNVRHAWNEQYSREAFLKFNRAFAPPLTAHWLWSGHRRELDPSWPSGIVNAIGPQGSASFWMTRVA